jgi:hypothetical protein
MRSLPRGFVRDRNGHHSLERPLGIAPIDGSRRAGDPVAHRRDRTRYQERRAGIQQHDVARRPRAAGQHALDDPRVPLGVTALQCSSRRFRQPDIGRMEIEGVDRTVAALGDLGVSGRGELVDPVRAVHDPGARRAEQHQRARQQFREFGPRHADDLPPRTGRIGQRSQEVERRPNAQFAPHRTGVTHRRMERRREEKSDSDFGERPFDSGRRRRDPHAQGFVDVGAARLARRRPIAVFGDGDAARRDHQRRTGRDVEGPRSIAAGAARVEQIVMARRQRHRVRAHRARQAHDLDRPFPFHRQAHEERRDVRHRRAAGHDLDHRRRRFVGRQVFVPREFVDQLLEHVSP